MRTSTIRRASLAALALIAVATTACGDSTSPKQDAQVRFVHAAAGKGAVNFSVDNALLGSNVAYAGNNALTYKAITAGERKVAARLTDGTTDLATATQTLEAGRQYTAVLVKRTAGEAIAIFPDTNTAAAAGKTRVRVINGAPAAASVDVYVTAADADLANATATLSDVKFEKASKYVEVAKGTSRVRFTTAGTKTVVLDLATVTLPDGGVRTIVLLDADQGGTPLKSITVNDRD
jgi:hypothetical protein